MVLSLEFCLFCILSHYLSRYILLFASLLTGTDYLLAYISTYLSLCSLLAPYSVVERDLLSWFLSLGRSMAVSSPGWKEGKWPKEGKPGKESLRPVARRELFPGGSSPRKPKWLEKEGWWKEARPCLRGEGQGGEEEGGMVPEEGVP